MNKQMAKTKKKCRKNERFGNRNCKKLGKQDKFDRKMVIPIPFVVYSQKQN